MKRTSFLCCLAALLFLVLPEAIAQRQVVRGIVLSASDKQPVIGAAIVESGTSNGTSTGVDGRFAIETAPGAEIEVTFLGYVPQKLKTRPEMQVLLQEDTQSLDEVVVTGYSTQRKADLTGAISIVNVAEMKALPDTDPMRALQGRIPGMTITADGSPSGIGTIRIRGIGSINSTKDPLFVIDGVPTQSSLNSLNANDIESIQVLKDAASASIYGSRAANGVIIITTKHGQQGKLKVEFNTSLTASFYTTKMDMLDTEGYGKVLFQANMNDRKDPNITNYGYTFDWNGDFDNPELYGVSLGWHDGHLDANKTLRPADTDWFDAISRTGFTQRYDISVSNGTERGNYLFSVGYKDTEGILKYTDFNSVSARMNSSFNLFKDIVVIGENFTTSYTTQVDAPGSLTERALKMQPILPVHGEDGSWGGCIGGMPDRDNPLRELTDGKENRAHTWRVFGNAYIDIKPVKGLLIRSNFGIDFDTYYKRTLNHYYKFEKKEGNPTSVTLDQANDTKWNWSNTINYDFTLADRHNFSILAGMELYHQRRIYFSGNRQDFALEDPDYMWPDAGTGTMKFSGNSEGYSLVSLFGKIDYNYDGRYLASFTIRRDGSSRFAENNKWAVFPAATLGWRISGEEFMQDVKWIDDLKIRASWGQTGNQGISNSARYSTYIADYGSDRLTSTAYDIYGVGSGIYPSGFRLSQTGGLDLKWETTTQTDIGLDFTLLDGSLYGTIDGYIKKIDDMLIQPGYLGSVGEGGYTWLNGPAMKTKGMEFLLGYRYTARSGFYLDLSANLDFFRSEVTYIPSTATGSYEHTNTELLIGHPYGARVGYVADGLFTSQEQLDASNQPGKRLGGIRFRDFSGPDGVPDGEIDAWDRTWIYDPVPDFSYGINLSMAYKGFDFSMFWQGVAGVDVENVAKYQTDFWGVNDVGGNKGARLLDAWTPQNPGSTIPAVSTINNGDEGRFSTYFIENGSYLKLRNLQIGYTLPHELTSKIMLDKVRIYISGQNLLTIKSRDFTGVDPEIPGWSYPIPTSVTGGIQLTF